MDAGLVLHPGVGPPAVDDKIRLFYTAKLSFVIVEQLHAPAHFRGVHGVHPEQAVGKQGAFLAAYAAANLHNDVFFIVGVFGQQQDLQLFVKLLLCRLGLGVGLLTQLLHFRIRH